MRASLTIAYFQYLKLKKQTAVFAFRKTFTEESEMALELHLKSTEFHEF